MAFPVSISPRSLPIWFQVRVGVGVQLLSRVWLFATPWTAACQAPLSMKFPRQEYWSGLLFPSPGDLPNPGMKLVSTALAGGFFTTEPPGKQRRQWHPTPVLLTGKSHGRRSPVGCSSWGRKESDMTEQLHFPFSLSCIGEGNGNPLQRSCLENPRDGRVWWAAVYGSHRVRHDWSNLAAAAAAPGKLSIEIKMVLTWARFLQMTVIIVIFVVPTKTITRKYIIKEKRKWNSTLAIVWKWSCSVVSDSLWPHGHQTPLSMGFSRQEYWSGLPFPSPGNFPTQGSNPGLPHCSRRFTIWATRQV